MVQATSYATVIWHVVFAIWVTLPLQTVGTVILLRAFSPKVFATFLCAAIGVVCFHWLAIPAIANTPLGGVLLHALFACFEDVPIAAWVYCLVYVVRLQDHVASKQSGRASPFKDRENPLGSDDCLLIVGNAPTVTDGAPMGSVMDSFTNVVRFNQYSVSRPAHTGSKVDFHFCNGRNFPSSRTVTAVLPLFNASLTHAIYLYMPHLEDAADIYANLTNTKVDAWFVEEERILELRRKIGCRVWQIPTSGMVAIDSFLSKRKEVFLHGFNFFEGKKIHYFEESPVQLIASWLESASSRTTPAGRRRGWPGSRRRRPRVVPGRVGGHGRGGGEGGGGPGGRGQGREGGGEEAGSEGPGLLQDADGVPSQFPF
ncbi:unnamed protein product [Prorocentrum cordatum]|uniref:Uncharacterized protein n=1 Tax=Prorocentrum cordatum TaxID=2364126 RepID=A0ABN9WI66_9DINO|nr:unnamed protein product [Polarella glacialis]